MRLARGGWGRESVFSERSDRFRVDLRRELERCGITQCRLAEGTGPREAAISRFLRLTKPEGVSLDGVDRIG